MTLRRDYVYDAVVVRVVDGDTIDFDVDLGFHVRTRQRFRLRGYNAPEMTGPERRRGHLAAEELFHLLPVGATFKIRTHRADAFGRWLCDVEIRDGIDLAWELIDRGFGVAWDGSGKRPTFDPDVPYPLLKETPS